MSKRHWLGIGLAAVVGCNSQDADCLAKLGARLGDGVRVCLAVNRQRLWDQVPACRGSDSVETRVSRRLLWDKTLTDLPIEVQVIEGVVELRGKVAGEDQRRRAIELAEATAGVEQVRDLLEVGGPSLAP